MIFALNVIHFLGKIRKNIEMSATKTLPRVLTIFILPLFFFFFFFFSPILVFLYYIDTKVLNQVVFKSFTCTYYRNPDKTSILDMFSESP